MEERIKISMLLDFYGQLLTDKQKDLMDLYYNDDLSLSEISEITNTSRQAIFDLIKRCQKMLLEYETALRLYERNLDLNLMKDHIMEKLSELEVDLNDKSKLQLVNDIKNELIDKI